MLIVQIVGGVLLAVGLFLFVASQWTGGLRSTDEAGLKAWSINISGPPGLILIVVGIMVFLFPMSPWWPNETTPPPTVPSTTTTVVSTTTFPDFYPEYDDVFVAAPENIWFDGVCVYWDAAEVAGWSVDVDVYPAEGQSYTYYYDSDSDEWWEWGEYGPVSYWCFWEDWNNGDTYEVWVWAYDWDGWFSEPAWMAIP